MRRMVLLMLLAVGPLLPPGATVVAQTATGTPAPPSPPGQPASGPGGAATPFLRSAAKRYPEEHVEVWLFEPATADGPRQPVTTGGPFPVVIFLSGCCTSASSLKSCWTSCHTPWLDHLAEMGNIVIFPMYRADHAAEDIDAGVRLALAELAKPGHAPPDLSRVALFGWSWGGVTGANYAATAAAGGLPVPGALLLFTPACGEPCALRDLGPVPATTRMAMVVGEDDDSGEDGAKAIWAALPQIPADRRSYVRLRSDRHGEPPLVTDHALPASPQTADVRDWALLDALDWYGLWRPFDALLTCTWSGTDCDLALGDSPQRRFMGAWSDGVPVAEPEIVADPGPPLSEPFPQAA